jgi:hypothetical protein
MTHELVYQPNLPTLKFGRRLHPDLRKLPAWYTVVRNPETGVRHIRSPNGYLLTNEGHGFRNPKVPSDWELWEVLRNYCRKIGQDHLGVQRVSVECKWTLAGNPATLNFIRYNDSIGTIRIECDKDDALIVYIMRQANQKYAVRTSRRRRDGGPIPGVIGTDYETLHSAFTSAMKQTWG